MADSTVNTIALQSAPGQKPIDLALRQLCLTLALTTGAVLLVYLLWPQSGYKMLMLGLGWPHVVLGFVFYFGGVLRGDARVWAAFLALLLLTLLIWELHYLYDIAALIYLYFLYHAFRDDIFVSIWRRVKGGKVASVFEAAGLVAVLLLLALLVAIQPKNVYRTLRNVELTGAQFSSTDWTLITFDPVTNSRGREFYFTLQAPHTAGLRAFTTQAATVKTHTNGEIRVNDEKWPNAADLIFQPYYAGEERTAPTDDQSTAQIPVLLTGGHRVGQTFTAERDNLAGIWLSVNRLSTEGETTNFVFHLSVPLLPYPLTMANLRVVGIILLSLIALGWLLLLRRKQNRQVWVYLLLMAGLFVGLQAVFKTSNLSQEVLRYFSQFVLVFHYILWYVMTFDKYRRRADEPRRIVPAANLYDRMLAYLRRAPHFMLVVIILNLISLAGVYWYYQLNAPPRMLYFFDYRLFLYFLAFHVTFSFKPDFFRRRKLKLSPER